VTDDLIDSGVRDARGRLVTLTAITDDNWRAVADVVPRDDQRDFVAPSAARYLLLSSREGEWNSLGIRADDVVVGHVMWGYDPDDEAHWVGGLVVDAPRQGEGLGRAAMAVLLKWLTAKPDCVRVRLSYQPENVAARKLYAALGFAELDVVEGDEVVAELVL